MMHAPLRNVQHLVEEQIRRAELVAKTDPPAMATTKAYWPVVTISREPCAGGTTIGRAIADRLGFACWDQELLSRIASEAGAVESIMASADERVSSRAMDFFRSLIVGFEYTQDEYRLVLTKVVSAIAAQGAAVIVGRGGHFILGQNRSLRVRIVCTMQERVRRMMARDCVPESVAQKRIRELGADVAAFMRHHFQKDVTSPEHYDLLVNSGTLDVEESVDLVLAAYRVRFGAVPRGAEVQSEPPPKSNVYNTAIPSVARVRMTGT